MQTPWQGVQAFRETLPEQQVSAAESFCCRPRQPPRQPDIGSQRKSGKEMGKLEVCGVGSGELLLLQLSGTWGGVTGTLDLKQCHNCSQPRGMPQSLSATCMPAARDWHPQCSGRTGRMLVTGGAAVTLDLQ